MSNSRPPHLPPPSLAPAPNRPGQTFPARPRRRSTPGRFGPLLRLPAGHSRFPHCPNRFCRFYQPSPDWDYRPWGFYLAPSCPQPLRRYQCRACRRTFSARTFASTYWLHRWDRFAAIAQLSVAGSGIRQIARSLDLAHATVARHLTRAARTCLVFHRQILQDLVLTEAIAIDGFETFEHSQFFPYHANLAVGQQSWLLYHFTDSPLRRKGRMTPSQKLRRQELEALCGRPDPKAVEKGVFELLRDFWPSGRFGGSGGQSGAANLTPPPRPGARLRGPGGRSYQPAGATPQTPLLELHSDDHPAYPRALRRWMSQPGAPRVAHQVTPSTDPRSRGNALFPVNLSDQLLRHCGANHRRETIAYDKRRQGGLERAAVFLVWRNVIKWRREKRPGETAAMAAGILPRRYRWREVLGRRRFPRESELAGVWWEYYWRRIKTAALGERQTENRAKFAF